MGERDDTSMILFCKTFGKVSFAKSLAYSGLVASLGAE